jgi:heterotetrameric sarcosine oxidase gamma subunit
MSEQIPTPNRHEYFKPVNFHDVALEARLSNSLVQVGVWPETTSVVEQAIISVLGLSLPSGPGGVTTVENRLLMAIAPETFLLEANEPDIAGKLVKIIEPAIGTVTDLTAARVIINLSGAGAQRVLYSGPAIDFDPGQFPVDRVKQSTIDGIGIIIRRVAVQEFELYVYQSLALALWDWLIEAGQQN